MFITGLRDLNIFCGEIKIQCRLRIEELIFRLHFVLKLNHSIKIIKIKIKHLKPIKPLSLFSKFYNLQRASIETKQ